MSEYDFETVDKTGKILPNIAELPYGHQSVLIYNDFNFDGKQDLALKDGNESCYGGSSFQVYTATANGFELNQGLSDLAHNKCGMFGTDNKQKLIYTMTKSGCCYHEYDTYGIINNSPSLQQHIVESVMTYMPDFLALVQKVCYTHP